jgi:catechol 2,3-dioxygenase
MIKLAGIGHVLLRVADEEASKRFYRDVLGFRVAEQDPEHGGVFMTLGHGFHTLDITQHPAPADAVRPVRGQLGLVHIAFKVDSYAALRDAYAHLLANGVEIERAVDHVCQRSIYFTDPDGNGLEVYCSRTAAATRTSACRSRAPASRYPPGSSKTGPARPLSRRSNASADRHQPQPRAKQREQIPTRIRIFSGGTRCAVPALRCWRRGVSFGRNHWRRANALFNCPVPG